MIGMGWFEIKEWDCGIGGMPVSSLYTYVTSSDQIGAIRHATDLYRRLLDVRKRDWEPARFEKWIKGARGHDLACFCPLDSPCHADVLLEVANS